MLMRTARWAIVVLVLGVLCRSAGAELDVTWDRVQGSPGPSLPLSVRTEHYLLWSDADTRRIGGAVRAVEALYADFMETFRDGIALRTPRNPLLVVCAAKPLSEQELRGGSYTYPGSYSSWHGVVVARMLPPAAGLDLNESTIRHEATHQLVHEALGLSRVARDRGFWYREGLACYFEGRGRYRLNGTVRVVRLGTLEAAYGREAIPRVSAVLALNPRGAGEMGVLRAYGLAWSLCHFLMHGRNGEYRERFLAYLSALREENGAGRGETIFARVIGDPAALQRDWVRHVYLLQRGSPEQLQASLLAIGQQPHQPPTALEKRLLPKVDAGAPATLTMPVVGRERLRAVWAVIREGERDFLGDKWESIRDTLDHDDTAVPALVTLLRKGRPRVRLLAAEALAQLSAREAMGALVDRALTDGSPEVRAAASRAIGKMNYGIAPEVFYGTLRAGSNVKVARAADALAEIGDPYAANYLAASRGSRLVGARRESTK